MIEAQEFSQAGMRELDNLIIGEERAKKMLLVASVIGEHALLVGAPGGGKSSLSGDFYRLFTDINFEQVATVPADAELSSLKLVGGEMVSDKSVVIDGETRKETTSVNVDGLIDEETRIIWTDEINRTSPYALNSLLPVLENRKLLTMAGTVDLPNLLMAISTMNPSESSQATFALSAAQASRHAMGAILGVNTESDRRMINKKIIFEGWEPTPENIKPIITTDQLKAIRMWASAVVIGESVADRFVELVIKANDTLADENIIESDGRMAKQMRKAAKAFAALAGEDKVDDEAMSQAVTNSMIARLAALKRYSGKDIHDIAFSVTES